MQSYSLIQLGKYSRTSWGTVGRTSVDAAIVLPLPQALIDSQKVQYEAVDLGWVGGGLLNTITGGTNIVNSPEGAAVFGGGMTGGAIN